MNSMIWKYHLREKLPQQGTWVDDSNAIAWDYNFTAIATTYMPVPTDKEDLQRFLRVRCFFGKRA